jgi:D-aspartate ligase
MDSRKAVVLGLSTPGATILRNLSRRGYQIWGITDDNADVGMHSKYGQKCISPDCEHDFSGWIGFMKNLAKEIQDRPVLIPTGDKYVVAIEKGIKELLPYYRMHQNTKKIHTKLTSKIEQVLFANKHGFPAPEWAEIKNCDEMVHFFRRISGPVLLKPEFSYFWHGAAAKEALDGAKILVAGSEEEARKIYQLAKPYSKRLLAQEMIPGEDDNLFYWTGIIGKGNNGGGRLIGKKIRVLPPGKGSASFVQLADNPEIDEQCEDFLKKIGYRGICGIEVKFDKRDGKYKLIEINPRYGLWEDIGIPAGIDLANEAVMDLYGEALTKKSPISFEQKWVSLHRDIPAYAGYRRESNLGIFSWLHSLKGPIIINDFPFFSDTPYAVHNIWAYTTRFISKVRTKQPRGDNYGSSCRWETTS